MADDLRYPIGKFKPEANVTDALRKAWIATLAETPQNFGRAVERLSPEQMETPYRPGGWTVRQVVHHVPDSHLNAYVRFRLALTEDEPTIKPYQEDKWAELADARKAPVEASLNLLNSLHERWVILLKSLSSADFARKFRHPEMGVLSLDTTLGLYEWHGRHHLAHITSLKERMSWR